MIKKLKLVKKFNTYLPEEEYEEEEWKKEEKMEEKLKPQKEEWIKEEKIQYYPLYGNTLLLTANTHNATILRQFSYQKRFEIKRIISFTVSDYGVSLDSMHCEVLNLSIFGDLFDAYKELAARMEKYYKLYPEQKDLKNRFFIYYKDKFLNKEIGFFLDIEGNILPLDMKEKYIKIPWY